MVQVDSDRNLLFGILAFQMDFISRDDLVAAMNAWVLQKHRPLADVLEERGALSHADRSLLEPLVRRHIEQHGGDPAKSLAALGSPDRVRNDLAPATDGDADFQASLAAIAPGSPRTATPDSEPAWPGTINSAERSATASIGIPTSAGQRFRILRPHARGGLGEVFVARDEELHREVALKQIQDRHADHADSRSRFLLEAEITGGLEHPGIVPVYGLGHYPDGRPYYAMRFIRGDSLKEAIEQFHRADQRSGRDPGERALDLRQLLRRFVDVCDAVAYAHSRGVLHRDLKPGNVMLGPYGETLVVDWGLAKPIGRSGDAVPSTETTLLPSSGSGLAATQIGSALGTPAYMSPEQAVGDLDRLGPRSDVYSLGATLYCLLTGKVPFDGDVGEVVRKVRRGDFPPPRQLEPSIDRALEAVCLKAMAVDPEDRYPSCRALAEEVERWAADEPVMAYREPFGRRARRWANRHRTAVTGVAVALAAGVIGLSGVLAVQTRARTALASANSELTRSKAAVEARYDLAVDAIKTFHTGVSGDFLLKQDQFKELRDRLLTSAADFYGKLSALLGNESDFASRRALAQANFDLADLTGAVGRKEHALAMHRTVLARRQALAADPAADPEAKADVGCSLIAVAYILATTGKNSESEATYRKAETLLTDLIRTGGSSAVARAELARGRTLLGDLLSSTGKPADALAAYRLAQADQKAQAAAPGASNEARREFAETTFGIGLLLSETGESSEAETEYRRALAIQRKLADDNPTVTQFRSSLAQTHNNLGALLSDTGKNTEAEAEYRQALAIRQKLVEDNLAVNQFRSSLAQTHNNLAILLKHTDKPSEAEAEYRQALLIRRKLANDNPTVADFRKGLALSHNNLGILLSQTGRMAEAEAEFRAALALWRKLAEDNADVTEFRNGQARSHNSLGSLLSHAGEPSKAEAEFRAALALLQRLAHDNPTITEFRDRLAGSHHSLGLLLSQTGKSWEAEAEFRAALAIERNLVDNNPTVADFRDSLAYCQYSLGLVLSITGEPLKAEAAYREALALFQKRLEDSPDLPAFRDYSASCLTNMADLLRKAGRRDEARAACERARALREPLVRDHPQVTAYRGGLAGTYLRTGQLQRDAGDLAGASAAWKRAVALSDGLESPDGEQAFSRSCCHAGLAGLAGRPGSGVSAEEGKAESDRAMTWLRRAVALGYRNPATYRQEMALDPLRDRDDFRRLLTEILDRGFPADPFAG